MSAPWLVDVHSHVVPSGDDGAATVEEGVELCRLAVEAGTRVLFTTPHVHAPWDSYPWSPARERLYDDSFPTVHEGAAALGLDVRRGWELFPSEVLERDPEGFRLEGTEAVLVEFPGSWLDLREPLRLVRDAVERVQAAGLTPVLAHPERCRAVAADPAAVRPLVEEGALLCLNAGSLLGDHGATAQRVAWRLVENGVVALAASDGHRARRPPTMDAAWMAAAARLGEGRARPLFDGSALPTTDAGGPLGVSPEPRPPTEPRAAPRSRLGGRERRGRERRELLAASLRGENVSLLSWKATASARRRRRPRGRRGRGSPLRGRRESRRSLPP